ncbi:MAG: hypothetical protein ACXIUO_06235 [Erythrobacter sp.]
MRSTLKVWTQLGLGTALAGGLLASCSGEAGEQNEAGHGSAGSPAATAGEGGEGGEGGEAGIDAAAAASDPVAYGVALAVVEAHVVAARDAFAAGRKAEAAEMFAHPVSEVLVDMAPVFAQQGVADFSALLTDASGAVLDGENAAQITKRYEAIIAALNAAGAKAPPSSANTSMVAARIIADQIERAAAMHREAARGEDYEPYLDGYGFARVAKTRFAASSGAIKASDPALHQAFVDALDLLGQAFPSADRPARLAVPAGALMAASSKVMLELGS